MPLALLFPSSRRCWQKPSLPARPLLGFVASWGSGPQGSGYKSCDQKSMSLCRGCQVRHRDFKGEGVWASVRREAPELALSQGMQL